ncbi:MAG: hypothetical protein V2A66_03200 [Pseudomonadota bacterium]
MTNRPKFMAVCLFALVLAALASGCAGEDYTPVFFPPQTPTTPEGPNPGENAGRQCTLTFVSQLCVTMKGDNIEVGTKSDDTLCADVPAFPIHINGTKTQIKGSEFPDIKAEGHGLPAPITINARGDGDGAGNVGEGTIDSSGKITVGNLSLFIVALGVVGEIPNLTLTTGSSSELPSLPVVTGSPPDATGAMTLVVGTVLGHTIDAADKYLKGASLTGVFKGSITPPLSQCGGEGEKSIEVKKLIISKDGTQTESPLPDGTRMEVSDGTYIAADPMDVGDRFETMAKFRVKNIGNKPQSIQIPQQTGPFRLSSLDQLTRELQPQQSFVLSVKFAPSAADKPGIITEPLPIGVDRFELSGKAIPKSASGSVSVVDDGGAVTEPNVNAVQVGDAAVPANTERAFFLCKELKCGESKAWTDCSACKDPETTPCELLPVSTTGKPMGEVDAQCKQKEPSAMPLYTIDLKGSGSAQIAGSRQVLAIRNKGATDMKITSVSVADVGGSKSKGEFSIPDGAIFVAKKFSEIQEEVAAALAGKKPQGARLPVTLPPYQPGYDETTIYVVVTYKPSDLMGSDGKPAGVGSKTTDRAVVKIATDSGDISTIVTGTTTISEAPALELYFKTSTGVKRVADGGSFPFRGVTPATVDLAVPLFLRVADTASHTLRVTSISLDGTDAANFKWLDTAQKIAAVQPPSGKGMRCSIPNVDETTGEMKGESFDLKPVSLDPPGFDLTPGAFSTSTMPLFGCVDFHSDGAAKKRLFEARITITAQEFDAKGTPSKNPDGSTKQTSLSARLLASINPRTGMMVLRITQTMAAIMNPQTPFLSSISSRSDQIAEGMTSANDLQVFTGAMILDPFDEMTIKTSGGKDAVSTPNDGITALFRAMDTHPVSQNYDDESLFDYAHLTFDSSQSAGSKGLYEDYPNVPEKARTNGWRIFTAALSYPGPLAPPEKMPKSPSDCVVINPCDPEQVRLFTDAGARGRKGACGFFYASGGRYDSPAFHTKDEMQGGSYDKFCDLVDKPQKLLDFNTGRSSVDGSITIEEAGLRFSGPTYFHNPGGPMGAKPPLDEIFYLSFTTGVLKPQSNPEDLNVLPDRKIDLSKNEFKFNLNDKTMATPPICEKNTKNRVIGGKKYSTWKYYESLLFKDEDGTIPAGCPDDGNKFTGGQAFLKGREMDQETGVATLVAAAKFSSSEDLTFAFKDAMIFIVLNGWLCDPKGRPEDFEGSHCYDTGFNERDAVGQISIVRDKP